MKSAAWPHIRTAYDSLYMMLNPFYALPLKTVVQQRRNLCSQLL